MWNSQMGALLGGTTVCMLPIWLRIVEIATPSSSAARAGGMPLQSATRTRVSALVRP